jgi:Domain of Unknown Function (DUF928)
LQRWLSAKPRDNGSGKNGGGRDPNLCQITPRHQDKIWRDRPIFVWKSDKEKIGLRVTNTRQITQLAVSQKTSSGIYQVVYSEKQPLQPGKKYDWVWIDAQTNETLFWKQFTVMPAGERYAITTDLAALEKELKAKGESAEAIAFQRANYFVDRKLWSDALFELYAVQNPSPELKKLTQNVQAQICPGTPMQ